MQNLTASGTTQGVTYTNNGDGSVTLNGTASGNINALYLSRNTHSPDFNNVKGHKVLLKACPAGGSLESFYAHILMGAGADWNVDPSKNDYGDGAIFTCKKAGNIDDYIYGIRFVIKDGTTFNNVVIKPMLIDLTAMFGSNIADYIYSLEQATAGAGVAWFKNLFPKPYYEYNAGELMSVCTNAHITRGFNAWDEEWESGWINDETGQNEASASYHRSKNYIPVFPNTAYYYNFPASVQYGRIYFYDKDKNFLNYVGSSIYVDAVRTTGSNVHYIRFVTHNSEYGTTYNHDICINLSWSGYRNGEYEPYIEHRYPLSPVELRGVPKLDSANNLYFDGDTYEKDGTVTRKYGIVDLGTLNWYKEAQHIYSVTPTAPRAKGAGYYEKSSLLCTGYDNVTRCEVYTDTRGVAIDVTDGRVYIHDPNFMNKTPAEIKQNLSGVYLVYEIETPTTETADPFTDPQVVDDFGTEEYVDALATAETNPRDVAIPVGHETKYLSVKLRDKLQRLPNMPENNGKYVV